MEPKKKRVVPVKFAIFKKADEDQKYPYLAVKRQRPAFDKFVRTMEGTVNILVKYENVPPAVNVFKLLRQHVPYLSVKYNDFKIDDGHTEEQFLKDVVEFYSKHVETVAMDVDDQRPPTV